MQLPVDLRSDTVTRPSPGMFKAMANAQVGDDVFGEDPSINALERKAAELVGKEDAIFVPSGTMGNQLAVFTHTRRGDEVLCGNPCHIQEHEVGAAAVISAVTLVPLTSPWGEMSPDDVTRSIREPDIHHPRTGLLCLESAHGSGAVPSMDNLRAVAQIAHDKGVSVHLDGARIFNAAVALSVDPRDIAAVADSVMFCLSKGLGAPVGSMLCGDADFIRRARKGRKLLGGGMRQAGILGAAGLYALERHIDRLTEDHCRAKVLAERLSELPGVEILSRGRDINMVWFRYVGGVEPENFDPAELVERLRELGVILYPPIHGLWRLVCHLDTNDEALDYACRQFESVFLSH